TPLETLRKAFSIGKREGLRYIYIGNVLGESEDTLCPNCHNILILRHGCSISQNKIKNSKCPYCGRSVPGVF
ncbi:MAG: radical SAM protein, partial [Acidobacteriota bacterium]|nr:radical SAM protein [Acidobacteriota bacterium]